MEPTPELGPKPVPCGPRQARVVTYDELRKSFNLPMTLAAKHFGVSLTLFKKICRKNGIRRWPHRKLKSLKTKIVDLQSRLDNNQGAREVELQRRLDELKELDIEPQTDSSCDSANNDAWDNSDSECSELDERDEAGALCLAMLAGCSRDDLSESRMSEGSVL